MTAIGRARKDYKCAQCERVIKKGEVYERFQSHKIYEKRCKECSLANQSSDYRRELLANYYTTYEERYAHLQTPEVNRTSKEKAN